MLTVRGGGFSLASFALASVLASVGTVLATPAQAAPATKSASADASVCGSYTARGNRYWGSCVSHGQEIRWHVTFPPDLYNYACVAPGDSMYIGPSATVWGVFATGDHC